MRYLIRDNEHKRTRYIEGEVFGSLGIDEVVIDWDGNRLASHWRIIHIPTGLSVCYNHEDYKHEDYILTTREEAVTAVTALNGLGAMWECETIEGISFSAGMISSAFLDECYGKVFPDE